MKIILTRDVPKVGRDGEVVTVADGYARNYLFPRHLAVVARGNALKLHQARVAREVEKSANLVSTARQAAEKLDGSQYRILGKTAAKSTRLYGAVTAADIADAIKSATGVEVDRRKIGLIDPIKITGEYDLSVRLHPEVTASFRVEVVTQEQLDARERERQIAEEKAARAAAAAADAAEVPAAADESAEDEPAS